LAAHDQEAAMNTNQELIASRKRAAYPDCIATFSLGALEARLPLRFPEPEGVRGWLVGVVAVAVGVYVLWRSVIKL